MQIRSKTDVLQMTSVTTGKKTCVLGSNTSSLMTFRTENDFKPGGNSECCARSTKLRSSISSLKSSRLRQNTVVRSAATFIVSVAEISATLSLHCSLSSDAFETAEEPRPSTSCSACFGLQFTLFINDDPVIKLVVCGCCFISVSACNAA